MGSTWYVSLFKLLLSEEMVHLSERSIACQALEQNLYSRAFFNATLPFDQRLWRGRRTQGDRFQLGRLDLRVQLLETRHYN